MLTSKSALNFIPYFQISPTFSLTKIGIMYLINGKIISINRKISSIFKFESIGYLFTSNEATHLIS